MSVTRVVAALVVIAAGIVVGAALAVAILPRVDLGPDAAAAPGEERVDDWDAAAAVAGIPLYALDGAGEPSALVVHGVPGDATRPIEARYDDGVVVIQAHRDLLPAEDLGELVSVPGADDGWWQSASDGRRLAVRFGDTLVLLEGGSDEELLAFAAELTPVGALP